LRVIPSEIKRRFLFDTLEEQKDEKKSVSGKNLF